MFARQLTAFFRVAPHRLLCRYRFAEQNKLQDSSLHERIVSVTTMKQFYQLYSEQKQQFIRNICSLAIQKMSNLHTSRKQASYGKQINDMIEGIMIRNLQTLTKKGSDNPILDIANIVFIVGKWKENVNYFNASVYRFLGKIIQKYFNLIKDRQIVADNIQELFIFYEGLARLNFQTECNVVSVKLFNFLYQGRKKKNLSEHHLQLLMRCLSKRKDLYQIQQQIRQNLLEQIGRTIQQTNPTILLSLSTSINRMHLLDLNPTCFKIIETLTDKILQNLPALDEKQIIQFAKGENCSKCKGFQKIYQKIFYTTLEAIQSNGTSTLRSIDIFPIIGFLSTKLSFKNIEPQNQQKFFIFLNNYGKNDNDSSNWNFKIFIIKLMKNDFFNESQVNILQNIIKSNYKRFSIAIIYEMSIKNYDISQFIDQILELQVTEETGNRNVLQVITVLDKLRDRHANAAYKFNMVLQMFTLKFPPRQFLSYIIKKQSSRSMIKHISPALNEVFSRLPNPFQVLSSDKTHRQEYIDYLSLALSPEDFDEFLQTNDANIQLTEIVSFISRCIKDNQRNQEPLDYLIKILSKKALPIIESKNKKYINTLLAFINRCNKFTVQQVLGPESEQMLLEIIRCLVSKFSVLIQTKQQLVLAEVLVRYLNRNYKNYNTEFTYRDLFDQIIKNISFFDEVRCIIVSIIKHGIRLNILTPNILDKINVDNVSIHDDEKMKAYYIKDSTFYPTLKDLDFHTLTIVLQNRNMSQYITQNEQKIRYIIQKANEVKIFNYAIYFNQPPTPASKQAIKYILKRIKRISSQVQYFQRKDLIGFFNNMYRTGYFCQDQCTKITQDILYFIKQNIQSYSIRTHIEVIRFTLSQPTVNANQYFSKLVEHYKSKDDLSALDSLYLWMTQTSHVFDVSDAELIEDIAKRNPQCALFCFLMLETRMQAKQQREIALKISERLITKRSQQLINEKQQTSSSQLLTKEKKTCNWIEYHYFKKAYAQETQSLRIPKEQLAPYHFSPLHSHVSSLLQQIAKISQSQLIKMPQFGEQNHVFRIKDHILVVINPLREGAVRQNAFLKRAIELLVDDKVKVVNLHSRRSEAASLAYIRKELDLLLSPQKMIQLQKTVKQKQNPLILIDEGGQSAEK